VNKGEAERGVRKLTDEVVNTGHQVFRVHCDCGAYLGQTHLSHAAKASDIGHLDSEMAKQLHITVALFRDITGCSKKRADYLAARGHQHT
jgi:hypothetical protein